jgi:hypothetical protein
LVPQAICIFNGVYKIPLRRFGLSITYSEHGVGIEYARKPRVV